MADFLNLLGINGAAQSAMKPNNPLAALVNNQAPEPSVDEILVTAQDQQPPNVDVGGPEPPFMGNEKYLDEAQMSLEAAPERKGMFGIKGTLRDVLGAVGDSFLIGSGRQAIYAPQREREKMGDAVTGFTDSYESAQAAAERLASMGYTNEAQQLMANVEKQRLAAEQQVSMAANRESQAADRQWGNTKDATNMIARILGSPYAQQNPAVAYAQAEKIAAAAGISLEDIGVRPDMTPEEMQLYSRRDMTVNQQEMLPRRDRQLDISQQNADSSAMNAQSSRIRANRPPAGRAPSNPTEASEVARIRERLNRGERLSAGDQATWDRYVNGTTRSGGNTQRRTVPRTQGWTVRRN